MRVLHKDFRAGEVKICVETLDDLWALHQLVTAGDFVSGKTLRKIKVTEEADAAKKSVFLTIRVKDVDFSVNQSHVRISGTVTAGPEDVPKGSYHTFSIEDGSVITIVKNEWTTVDRLRLGNAIKHRRMCVLVCVFDREEALIAHLTHTGHEIICKLAGEVDKKVEGIKAGKDFFVQLSLELERLRARENADAIVLASPAFWKDPLWKVLSLNVRKISVFSTCSSVTESAISEVLRREETSSALKNAATSQEMLAVEKILAEIAKNGKVAYGIVAVSDAGNAGAIESVCVSDGFIQRSRQNSSYDRIEHVLQTIERAKGTIMLVSSSHDGGKKLDGIGGIAALLRYKVEK